MEAIYGRVSTEEQALVGYSLKANSFEHVAKAATTEILLNMSMKESSGEFLIDLFNKASWISETES
ncbi:hypothetical protein KHA80_04250 [Anaerobacillus sp. HL2]|nr:hypothetical protein KHA80_04250 [Anaerobacillus sp. HL2]